MKELIRVMKDELKDSVVLKGMGAMVIGIISFCIPVLLIKQICSDVTICLTVGFMLGLILICIEILIYNIKSRQKEYSCSMAEAYKMFVEDCKDDGPY